MEFSSWNAGEEGLPEDISVFLRDGEPVASCKLCRASIIENNEAIIQEEAEEPKRRRRNAIFIWGYFILVVLISIAYYVIEMNR
jgi:hypothetical protein